MFTLAAVRLPKLLAAAGTVVALAVAPMTAQARVSQGFVGMNGDLSLFDSHVNLSHELDRMVASGVQTLRLPFDWSSAQPYQHESDVPPARASQFQNVGGVPTNFSTIDRIVGLAAARKLALLPVVVYAPPWDAEHQNDLASPPKSDAPYAAFMTALVNRYGPHGVFWSQNPSIPRVPIENWQIWNEPNLPDHWSDQPSLRSTASVPAYVRLLRAAHNAIRAADPHATVVLAGLPDYSWEYLAAIYKVRGVRQLFDVVAIHPYTGTAAGVIELLQRSRDVMNKAGDRRKPILATELGWPSSQGEPGQTPPQIPFGTTQRGQSVRLARLLPLIDRYRHSLVLSGFDYYTWMGFEPGQIAFDYAGLSRLTNGRVFAKPALSTFTRGVLSLEGCKRKGKTATACLH